MDDRELNILHSAVDVFSRYGVKRTTMADIAESAGIARQTLYNSFPNKDAILRGTIELHAHLTMNELREVEENSTSLADALDTVFYCVSVRPFELLLGTPHGEELLEGFNKTSKDRLHEAYAEFRNSVYRILQPHEKALKAKGISLEQLSDLIVTSLTGFKKNAESREHLQQLYEPLKAMILNVCEA